MKTRNLPAEDFETTRNLETWARDKVMWYWSAGSLFWQLSIDHRKLARMRDFLHTPICENVVLEKWKNEKAKQEFSHILMEDSFAAVAFPRLNFQFYFLSALKQ